MQLVTLLATLLVANREKNADPVFWPLFYTIPQCPALKKKMLKVDLLSS